MPKTPENAGKTLFTIGHSTRTLDEFIALLKENGVERLADIRRYPGSRRYPHFSREALRESLPAAGIEYVHIPELGGRRKPLPDSPNTAWRNEQFRAYADHMVSDEFRTAVDRLLESVEDRQSCLSSNAGSTIVTERIVCLPLGSDAVTAVMCAEAVPWRCHRNLLADELVRRGVSVFHIISKGATQPHKMNPSARVVGTHLEYR